jgi:hypothetical protein
MYMYNQHHATPEGKDPQLWEIAQKRASFKSHLLTYVVINAFLWILWYFTGGERPHNGWPWPVWPMLGWGIGLFFHYASAYIFPKANSVEKEYEKLKQQQQDKSSQ